MVAAATDQLTRPSRRSTTSAITIPVVNKTMAEIVGMEPDEPERVIRAITYACPCGGSCRACSEDSGTRIADVDDWCVGIGADVYDRGIESEERIDRACASVDEDCRADLEWLLRHGPSDDVDSPAMQAVIARAEREERAIVEPVGIMAVLRDMMLAATEAVDPRKEERLRRLSITQLSGFIPVGGWQA